MADETFDGVPDLVPISDAGDGALEITVSDEIAEPVTPADSEFPPPEGFTPKEIQASVFSAAVQIYNGRRDERDYDGKVGAARDAVTLFSICGNKKLIAQLFEEVTATHLHPYDVFARAEMEIEGMFNLPSES